MKVSEQYEAEPTKSIGCEFVGPFQEWHISCDGFRVPRLSGRVIKGVLHLSLDGRFGLEVPEEYANQVVWFVANAIAVGAGYSCFGEHSQIANPFKTRMAALGLAPEIELETKTDAAN